MAELILTLCLPINPTSNLSVGYKTNPTSVVAGQFAPSSFGSRYASDHPPFWEHTANALRSVSCLSCAVPASGPV